MAGHIVTVRFVAIGFMAQCLVCCRWAYWRLAWKDRDHADDLRCQACRGECEADGSTIVAEIAVAGESQLVACS